MVVGYVRLSKDDNKKDYVSIENQKLILTQYAKAKGLIIERWYEDDGVSGYSLERPGFTKLLADLEKEVDVILAKDLSRIGRHNAKVLLFLEEVKEMGKRVLLADDAYDSRLEEDDTLGIKTWFNERYVKDTSKKIRRAIRARQIEGTLAVNTPMGYLRNPLNKTQIIIDEKAAPIIRRIFALYLSGYGFRTIAEQLDREGVPTASLLEKERLEAMGKSYGKRVSLHWSPKMVGEIIKNDIYIGTMRYHKNERITIHGKDNRVGKEEQMVFYHHHPAVIDEKVYKAAMELLHRRIKDNYRGVTSGHRNKPVQDVIMNDNIPNNEFESNIVINHNPNNVLPNTDNKYRGFLYCETCGSRMTMIHRKGKEPYYICGKYNSKGKQFCSQSKQISLSELDGIIKAYRCYTLRINLRLTEQIYRKIIEEKLDYLKQQEHQIILELEKEKKELKYIMLQKMQLAFNESTSPIQQEIREEIEHDKLIRMEQLQERLKIVQEQRYNQYQHFMIDNYNGKSPGSAFLQNIIINLEGLEVTRTEVECVIHQIVITPDGEIRVFLTHHVYETGWYAGDGIRVYPEETGN